MYLRFALLVTSVTLYGQASAPEPSAQCVLQELQNVELSNRTVALEDLTEEQAVKLEQSAYRQLEQCAARVEQLRVLATAGLLPYDSLDAPREAQVLAHSNYGEALLRRDLVRERVEMARAEQAKFSSSVQRFAGDGSFTADDFRRIKKAFEEQFHKMLPVSAEGETAVHRSMGFDHRNRVDVAIFPDTAEGVWLRHYLEATRVPYYAFRSMVPGKATGAHIHIGPPSNRLPSSSGS
jgi:hypothetical protein